MTRSCAQLFSLPSKTWRRFAALVETDHSETLNGGAAEVLVDSIALRDGDEITQGKAVSVDLV